MLEGVGTFTSEKCEHAVKTYLEKKEMGLGGPMNGLRLALVGNGTGAHLFDIMEIIGQRETIARIDNALATLKVSAE